MDDVVSVVRAPHQTRDQLVHRLDGRYGALRPSEVRAMAERLAGMLDLAGVDAVLGIPEGGSLPAFALAQLADLPLVLATRTVVELQPRLVFREPHVPDAPLFYVYGVEPGTRLLIVEDEVTTGRTLANAVRALRRAGIVVKQAGAFFVVDHPATRRRLQRADIELYFCRALDGGMVQHSEADGASPKADGR